MTIMEPFTFIDAEGGGEHRLMQDVLHWSSAKRADVELQYLTALRRANPDMIITVIPPGNVNLRAFAAAGFARSELDLDTDSFAGYRGYVPPAHGAASGSLGESVQFGKYRYHWGGEDFILYTVDVYQFVLKERKGEEDILGPSATTDALILAIGNWRVEGVVWVFDNYWYQDKNLYQQVLKMTWDKVILDEDVKKDLTSVAETFFSSKSVYDDLGVPWKRGLLWHGPPGNGKTVSIKALMHTLLKRTPAIPTLYVKSAPQSYHINAVFTQARNFAPCMLVLEDIETIVTPLTRSYFFNQMDGLEDNSGLFVVATTNFLDKLDPGLSKRPSRFDRKYLFPIPNEHERFLYAEFWRRKLEDKPEVEFPKELSPAMAKITPGFSFAFLQECFVATLLVLAQANNTSAAEDLDKYPLWVEFQKQAKMLRKQFEDQTPEGSHVHDHALVSSIPSSAIHSDRDASFGGHGSAAEGQDPLTQALQTLSVRPDSHLPGINSKYMAINPACFEMR